MRAPTVHNLKTRISQALRDDWKPKQSPRLLAPPTYNDVIGQLTQWLVRAAANSFNLSVDIETLRREFISCIGFSDSPSFAISIPFVGGQNPDGALKAIGLRIRKQSSSASYAVSYLILVLGSSVKTSSMTPSSSNIGLGLHHVCLTTLCSLKTYFSLAHLKISVGSVRSTANTTGIGRMT